MTHRNLDIRYLFQSPKLLRGITLCTGSGRTAAGMRIPEESPDTTGQGDRLNCRLQQSDSAARKAPQRQDRRIFRQG